MIKTFTVRFSTSLFLLLSLVSQAQVQFKVELLANDVYQVSLRSEENWDAPLNITNSGAVTLVVPTGGFLVNTVTDVAGNWERINHIIAPAENPTKDYLVFTLQAGTSEIVYNTETTSVLFTFPNDGTCTGAVELINNDTDLFMNNDQNILVGNQLTVLGAGAGVNAYSRNYNLGSADCTSVLTSACGITVTNVLKTSPSTCGVADGIIEIVAEQNGTLPPLQYSINGGVNWQASPIFPNLAAGFVQVIAVRDMAALCRVNWGEEQLDAPLSAAIRRIDVGHPTSCGGTDGSFFISAFNEFDDELQFSIDNGATWSFDSLFENLVAGTYDLVVRNNVNDCISPIGEYTLIEDCSNQSNCLFEFEIEEVGDRVYEVSLIPQVTYNFPNNITSTAQVTFKVPTGGFVMSNLQSLVNNVNFIQNSRYNSPDEATNFDYITIGLGTQSTTHIPYEQGVKVPLFTFENTGSCSSDSIYLMNNETDPFLPPNSENASVGMQITTSGSGADAPICLINNGVAPCSGLDIICTDVNAGQDEEICEAGQVQLQATGGAGNYIWSPATGLSCTHCPNPTASPTATTTYTVTSDDGTCTSSDMLTVTIVESPKPDFFVEVPCDGVAAQFSYETNGSTNGLSWLWDFDDNGATSSVQNPTYTFSGPGDYTVTLTVTQNGQCSGDISKVITVHPSVSANAGQDVSICGGENVQLLATGGTQYIWTPTTGLSCSDCPNPTAQPNTTTTYTVTVLNDNDCSDTDEVTVSVGAAVTISAVNAVAPSDCTNGGSIAITASCANDCALEYSIDNGQNWFNTANFNNVNAGQYNVQVRAANTDCVSTYANNPVNISTADSPQINQVTTTNPNTCGSNTGSISINANCMNACTLEYSIDNGQNWVSNATFNNLPAGDYDVQVRVENTDCISDYANNPVTIADGDAPQFDNVVSSNPVSCEGGGGSITITASCADACTLEYSINNGQTWVTNPTFSNVPVGSHHVQVRVANSTCVNIFANNPVIISAANSPQIDEVSSTDPSTCGASDGTITISASGGTAPLQYSIDGGNNFQSSPVFTDLFPATYAVVVANNNESCPVTHNNSVIINPTGLNNDISVEVIAPSDCEVSDGSIMITASPSDNLEYSINDGADWSPNPVFNNLNSGTYRIKIRMAGGFCSADYQANPVVLVQPNPPTVNTPLSEFTTCEGITVPIEIVVNQTIDSFRVYGNGGYLNDILQGSTLTFDAVATDEVSDFHVEIYGTSGCSVTESFKIFRIDAPVADFEISEPVCTGGETTITFTGEATATAILDWSLDGATLITSSPATATASEGAMLTVRWPSQGNKTVELFIQDGQCEATMNEDISVIPFPIAVNTMIEDASGCGTNDGSIDLVILNDEPYQFAWSGPNAFTSSTQNISGLQGGDYTVTITDVEAGCTLVLAASVEEPSSVFIGNTTTVNDASCEGSSGQIALTIGGGIPPYTFELLQNGNNIETEITFQNNYTFENLAAGNYTLMVTDLNECTDSQNVNVTAGNATPPTIEITNIQASACGAANGSITIEVNGNSPAYTYELFRNVTPIMQGNLPPSNQITFNDLDVATYTVVVADNQNCSGSQEVTMTSEAADFEIDAAINAPSCDVDNGSITLSNFPTNATFAWSASNGATLPNQSEISNLASGVYFVTVSVGNGCSTTFNYNLEPSDGPQVVIQSVRDIVCGGLSSGAVFFEVQSAGTFDYEIMGQNITGSVVGNTLDSIVNLMAGGYVLNITNTASNCTTSLSFLIEQGDALQVIAISSPATECYVFDGEICLNISGGEAPYTIEANKGIAPEEPVFGNACITGLYDGVVDIKVIDANGCAEIFRIVFNDLPTCSDTLTATIPTGEMTELCFGDLIQLPGELMEATICHQNESQIGIDLQGNETCVTATPVEGFTGPAETICIIHCQDIFDNNYCDTTFLKLFVEDVACELIVEGRILNEATCGLANGSASLQVIGNVGTLQYNWSNNLLNSNAINNLVEGTYYVTITDEATDCILTDSIVMTNIPGATLSLTAQAVTCANRGKIEAIISGGTAPFNIQWSGAAIGSFTNVTSPYVINNLPAGNYEVEIQDAYNCIDIQSISIANEESNITIINNVLTNPSCGAANAQVELTISGFTGSYDVLIDDVVWLENQVEATVLVENLAAGTYLIEIMDDGNCTEGMSLSLFDAGSPIVLDTEVVSMPNCEANNGSFQLFVEGFTGVYEVVINDSLWLSGQQAEVILVENLAAGNYLIEIMDEGNCSESLSLSLFEVGSPIVLDTEVVSMPNCEVNNGSFQLFVNGFTGTYEVIINDSLWFSELQDEMILIENVGVGNYNIVIKDSAGCTTEGNTTLESVESPALALEDVILTHFSCPNDNSGSIQSALAHPLLVFNSNGLALGATPMTGLAAGEYEVRDTVSACPSELQVTILGIEDWSFETTITPATCQANDGSISIAVSGANGGYTFDWSPAVSESSAAVNLMADSIYSVTITDSVGCTQIVENLIIPIACDTVIVDCDPIFALDTFTMVLSDSLMEICLPLNVLDTIGWAFILNDSTYGQPLGTCITSSVFYNYGTLLSTGDAPYRLESWTFNNNTIHDFEFTTIEALVAEMNNQDILGNWVISETDNSIWGGAAGGTYGNLQITHIESNTTLTLQLNNASQTRFSITLAEIGQHQFVIQDGNCQDTLVINLLAPETERPQIFVEEYITLIPDTCGGVAKLCLPFDDPFNFDITVDDDLFLGNFVNCNFDDPALPLDTGFHEIIIFDLINLFSDTVLVNVMCDTLNIPIFTIDTIYVEIPVGESEEVCMDINELPGFILSIENTCEDPLDAIVDVVLDIYHCVEVIAQEIGTSQACIVLCNELGFCDTTIVIISVTSDSLIIYNGLSPNGDGVNEHFQIDNIERYPNNTLSIYNRWGARVYRTESYTNRAGWTGTFADKTDLPDGTYFYILDDGEDRVYKGFLEVRR